MDIGIQMGVAALTGLILCIGFLRKRELKGMSAAVRDGDRARAAGDLEARLSHPVIDLSKCLGCGTCVEVCPESGVLDLIHGQAAVVRGAACKGIAACEAECPVGAVTVTVANLETRFDVPRLDQLEVPGNPGLYLAGEVTAHGSIRIAFEHGLQVAARVKEGARSLASPVVRPLGIRPTAKESRFRKAPSASYVPSSWGKGEAVSMTGALTQPVPDEAQLDLLIVGSGPAGFACALAAKQAGLRFLLLDQAATLGGAIAHFPRRKLVLTNTVTLPLAGKLRARSYRKEELLELWQSLASKHNLPIETGLRLTSVTSHGPAAPLPSGGESPSVGFTLSFESMGLNKRGKGSTRQISSDAVCLALGRGGSPLTLGVPGEELPKVQYALEDAANIMGKRILVVGGGLAAAEAALALSDARKPGASNQVTLVHRRDGFSRLAADMEDSLMDAANSQGLRLILNSEIKEIGQEHVVLKQNADGGDWLETLLPNDLVLIMVGGKPALELLKQAGVRFAPAPPPERASPSLATSRSFPWFHLAVAACFVATVGVLFAFQDYYQLSQRFRPEHSLHDVLRPGAGFGLLAGMVSLGLILVNLAYLPRRGAPANLRIGSLAAWMRVHVATGLFAPVLVFVHAAAAPRQTVGGHGFWALVALVVTGTIGRYLYSVLPRAANGAELAQTEIKRKLQDSTMAMDSGMEDLADEALELVNRRQWGSSLVSRLFAVLGSRRDLHKFEQRVRARWQRNAGDSNLEDMLAMTRVAYRRAMMLAHLEDLRALGASWRYFHRWVAILMVVLVTLHIAHASAFGGVLDELGRLFDFGVRLG